MPTSELEQFCALFAKESDLQEKLADLLGKLDGVSGVRILQGVTERGKDLIFYHHNPFGNKRLIACVVKNTPITGNVASQSGARTVLFQSQQAFDTPYVNSSGQEERVEHVYIISPHPSTADAIESVKGGLQQRSGQVTFLCGNDLLDVFKEKWPSFLAFEGDFLGRYLNDLRKEVDSNPILSALTLRHSIVAPASRLLSAVYVPQRLLITLMEFKARHLSWYRDILQSAVGLAELQDAQFNLNIVAGVLTSGRLWARGSQYDLREWPNAALTLRRVGRALFSLWEQGYRELMRKSLPNNVPSREVALVRLAPDESLLVEYSLAIRLAQECWKTFVSLVNDQYSRARKFPQTAEAVLLCPEYPAHCTLVEAANRTPLAIAKSSLVFSDPISSSEFTELRSSVLITAPAGFGKTSFCRYHALRDSERLLKGESDVLPIYVQLHQIARTEGTTFSELFLRGEHLRELLESGSSSVITSKPAIHDHFKTGQQSCTQNMKLLYLADARSGKFCSVSF